MSVREGERRRALWRVWWEDREWVFVQTLMRRTVQIKEQEGAGDQHVHDMMINA